MDFIFEASQFNGDISNWKPYSLQYCEDMFMDFLARIPGWLVKMLVK